MSTAAIIKEPRKITGRMVLIGMIAFFGVVSAVNGVFIYFALDTWPGLAVENSYERGLNYNEVLNQARRQSQFGWTTSLRAVPEGITFELTDRDKRPVSYADVAVKLSRPASARFDQEFVLTETSAGTYSVKAVNLEQGRWLADVLVRVPNGQTYRTRHDLAVRQ